MIGRRKSPDGLPFRLYMRQGKFKTSYGYKLPDGSWAFRLSATTADVDAVAAIKADAIQRANLMNGEVPMVGSTDNLFRLYFSWQEGLPLNSEDRKAAGTLKENKYEQKRLLQSFGKVKPSQIRPVHVYKYLAGRASQGAPAKANKEIALLSAVLEYGRRLGELEENPCRGIKYNKTRPKDKYVSADDLDLLMRVARQRGGAYVTVALCLQVAYLTVSRPEEMRWLVRQGVTDEGIRLPVGKRKGGQVQRHKLIHWSPELRSAVSEALSIQRTTSIYVFGNTSGQPYTVSGFNTNLRRLMEHCAAQAEKDGVTFTRFTLADMRPSAVTDRMEEGDTKITDATGHKDGRMVAQVYDRRRTKSARATK